MAGRQEGHGVATHRTGRTGTGPAAVLLVARLMVARLMVAGLILAGLPVMAAMPAAARCATVIPQPKPQNTGRDIVGQDLDQIRDRGHIEFAVYEDFAPYSWQDGGKPAGVDIALGGIIAADLGVDARFRFVGAGETVDADLRNHVWKGALVGGRVSNVMLHVPYNADLACRNEQVVLTGHYANERVVVAYRRDAYPDGGPGPAHFRFDTVAVENDSIADFYLSAAFGGQMIGNVRRFPSPAAAMAALAAGETKAAMGPRAQLEFGLTDDLALHAPPLPGFALGEWTVGVAVRHSYRPLAYAVDDAIRAAVTDGRLRQVYADHGLTWSAPAW